MTYEDDAFLDDDRLLVRGWQPCNGCNGSGWDVDTACCGGTYPDGECRAVCAVQVQVECSSCGGSGEVPA